MNTFDCCAEVDPRPIRAARAATPQRAGAASNRPLALFLAGRISCSTALRASRDA